LISFIFSGFQGKTIVRFQPQRLNMGDDRNMILKKFVPRQTSELFCHGNK